MTGITRAMVCPTAWWVRLYVDQPTAFICYTSPVNQVVISYFRVSEIQQKIASQCLQLLGGWGYMWSNPQPQLNCHFIFQGVRNPAEDSITVSPTAWWVGLHVGVPHSQGLCRRPCPAHIWWQQRDHERTHSETNHF